MVDLARRGLLDPQTSIRDYPYRDDALLVHEALHDFVEQCLALYYNQSDVLEDDEPKGWLSELRAVNVAGLPDIETRRTRSPALSLPASTLDHQQHQRVIGVAAVPPAAAKMPG